MTTAASTPRSEVALTRDLSEFLIELSIAAHRFAIYPKDHPSLGTAVGDLSARLHQLLRGRESIALGVAQEQLVIDGVATDKRNPVLTDLARRLHGHQLGAVTFMRGFDQASVQGLLEALASDHDGESQPLGLLPPGERPSWPGVVLASVGYEDLEIDDEAQGERARNALQLWIGLARAAVSVDTDEPLDEIPDTEEVAAKINAKDRDRAYDQVIIGYLLQLSEELGRGGDGDQGVRNNVSQLVKRLDRSTLARILEMGGDMDARRQFLQSAMDALPSMAVVQMLDAAAEASGTSISRSLTMLLTKLARHADDEDADRSREGSEHLSEEMDRMLRGWELDSPNPEQYDRALRDLSNFGTHEGRDVAGPAVSVIQMAIEVDQYGDTVEKSLLDLVEAGELTRVAPIILEAEGSEAAASMRERLSDPSLIGDLSQRQDVDPRSLALLTDFLEPSIAAASLVDLVRVTESDQVRAKALERLMELVDHIGDGVSVLLESDDARVVLAGLHVVRRTGVAPAGFSPLELLASPNAEVRGAALEQALQSEETRATALDLALRTGDEQLQGTALESMAEDPPEEALSSVVREIVARPGVPPWLSRMGIHVLSASDSEVALEGLLDFVVVGRTLFGRPKLADPDRAVIDAIEALGRHEAHANVANVLKQARRSKDERVRRAAGRRGR